MEITKALRIFFGRALLFVVLSMCVLFGGAPSNTLATSCKRMWNRYILRCHDGICTEGFLVFEQSTRYLCGRRPVIQAISSQEYAELQRFFSQRDQTKAGIYELTLEKPSYDPVYTVDSALMRLAVFVQDSKQGTSVFEGTVVMLSESVSDETLQELRQSWIRKGQIGLYLLWLRSLGDGSVGAMFVILLIVSSWKFFSLHAKQRQGEAQISLRKIVRNQFLIFLGTLSFVGMTTVSFLALSIPFALLGALFACGGMLVIWPVEGLWFFLVQRLFSRTSPGE